MDKSMIEEYQIISTKQLVRAIKEGKQNSERFCFILGAGASASSHIPTGVELERRWMAEMEEDPGFEEIRSTAQRMQNDKQMDRDFGDIEKAWETSKASKTSLPSEFYFDIYKLRFFPNYRNGYHYLEKVMTSADVKPSFGYHPLALMLTEETRNNLVITTNFDSLIEDALFLYTTKKPLVINHELLADYVGDPNITRPIIAKIHRGIFFDPLNRPEETNELKGKWHDVLAFVFQSYTPIVIGYGGGDNSLMELLTDENVKMKNGMYWCYMEEYGLPGEKIQRLVKQKKGYLVRTAGFDATMLAIGNALFPDKIGVHETEAYLTNQTTIQISNYEKQYLELTKPKKTEEEADGQKQTTKSEKEFRKEIEKITKRGDAAEKNREKSDQMTAWDYWRQGMRYHDSEQYEKAIECYTKAIEMQPNTSVFYEVRGLIYDHFEEYELAIVDFNKAILLNPDNSATYNSRGIVYLDLKQYKQAIVDLSKAFELDPNDFNSYISRGFAYALVKKYDQAIDDFNKAIELKPDDSISYVNRGTVYMDVKQYNRAIADLNKAIELNPDMANTYNNRGLAYTYVKQYNQAMADLNKAIELDPDMAKAYSNRGFTYIHTKQYDQAMADLNKAMELNPNSPYPYKHCGTVWMKKGDLSKAIDFFTKAIELNPDYKDAYLARAEAYRLKGEISKAEEDEATASRL